MGPTGMREIGDTIVDRTRYAMTRLASVPGTVVAHGRSAHFREFVLDLNATGQTVADIDSALRECLIFAGVDLSREHPNLGQSLLVCVTERHTMADIDRFAENLQAAL